MKKQLLLLIIGFFVSGTLMNLSAQNIGGQEFADTVCDVSANSIIDLGKDVVGADLNMKGGEWHAVDNSIDVADIHATTGTYAGVNDSKYIETVTNVFSLVNKPVGVYSFVYVATNNACLPTGEKVLVRIYIEETAKELSHTLAVCPNTETTIALRDIVAPSLRNTAAFSEANGVNMPGTIEGTSPDEYITIPATWEGIFSFEYQNTNAVCNSWATIYITVTRDADDLANFELVDTSATYCVNAVPNEINLTNLSGASFNGGVWTVKTTTPAQTGISVTTTGDVTINNTDSLATYTFEYTYTDCESATQTKVFAIEITDDLGTGFVDSTDDICKSSDPTRVYDLLAEGFNMNIPNSSGTWTVISQPIGNIGLDISNGLFLVANARTGVYEFQYKVSSAATELCGLADKSAKLTLTVGDVSGGAISDGRLQLCVDDVEAQATAGTDGLVLGDFIIGLEQVENVVWTGPTGVTFAGTNLDSVAYADLETLGVGVHKFEFTYTSPGCDETELGTGSLYVDITGELDMNDVTIAYCRPDMPADLNLNGVIGVNIPGTWSIVSATGGALTDSPNGNPASGNGILFNEDAGASGIITYEVKFTPTSTNCGAKEITVTIRVSDNDFN